MTKAKGCDINHAPDIPRAIGDLPYSQASWWRHKCAGCAYLLGERSADNQVRRLKEQVAQLEARIRELEATRP